MPIISTHSHNPRQHTKWQRPALIWKLMIQVWLVNGFKLSGNFNNNFCSQGTKPVNLRERNYFSFQASATLLQWALCRWIWVVDGNEFPCVFEAIVEGRMAGVRGRGSRWNNPRQREAEAFITRAAAVHIHHFQSFPVIWREDNAHFKDTVECKRLTRLVIL